MASRKTPRWRMAVRLLLRSLDLLPVKTLDPILARHQFGGHVVEGGTEFGDLVGSVNRHAHIQISGFEPPCGLHQTAHRSHDSTGHQPGSNENQGCEDPT